MNHFSKYSFFIVYLLILSIFKGQVVLYNWSEKDYLKYDLDEFQKLSEINEPIITDSVDHRFLSACIFYATNIERKRYNKSLLNYSKYLEQAAQIHSQNMVKHNFYSHTCKIKGQKTMVDRLKLVGIENAYMGENICYFFLDNPSYWSMAVGMVDGWMNSKGHKENILNKNYKYLGCGIQYYYESEWPNTLYVKSTQNFSSIEGD